MGIFKTLTEMILKFCLWFVKWLGICILPIIIMIFVFVIYYLIKGKRFPKRKESSTYKPENFFKRIFFDFPQRFVLDLFERNPDKFPIDGLHLFAGEQGSGKSIASVEFCLRMKKQYPKCRLRSNINLKFQDDKLSGWEDIVFDDNGVYGDIAYIDEIQNWFNSNESRNFPPDMIQEICQLRKQVKVIIGTSQVFARVAKPIREQVTVLYKPMTLLGCLTIVRCYKPLVKQDGTIEKLRKIKTYFFVHNDELRNAYDTYEKVERLARLGFKSLPERIGDKVSEDINVQLKK